MEIDPNKLKDFIEAGGIGFHNGSVSFIFSCPRCKKKKLYVHKETGHWICFYCVSIDNFKGNRPEWVLSEIYELPIQTIKEKLYQIYYKPVLHLQLNLKDLWDYSPSAFGYFEEELTEVDWDPNFVQFGEEFKPGLEYLLGRGIGIDIIKKYDVRYDPIKFRVILPVKYQNSLYGWQGRYIKKTEFIDNNRLIKIPKILTSLGLKKERILMFQDNLDNSEHAVLTEGPFDALKCDKIGGNVASMGKAVSDWQLNIIKSKTRKLYIGIDPDAVNEVDRIARKLYGEIELFLLQPLPGFKDLGEASLEENYEAFMKAKRLCGQIYLNLRG